MAAGPGTLKGASAAVLFLPKFELSRSSPSSRQHRRLQCRAFLGPVSTSLPTATTGWLIAGAVLAAVRLGRKQAEDASLERLQGGAEGASDSEQQALLRRRLQDRRRAQQASELAMQRLQEARLRAVEQERERQAENQRLLEAAERQKAAADKARAAERAAYEAKEDELCAELERRAEVEREIRTQKLAAQKAAEAQSRREAEERRRQQELERQRQEEEALRQLQLERERKAAERRRIQRLSKHFAVTLEGSVTSSIPPEGAMTEGRLPKPAEVQVQIVAGSMLGGSATWGPLAYESVQAASEQLLGVLAEATSLGAAKYAATARLQNMMGEGPLAAMSEAELAHWMRCASTRAAVGALPGAESLLQQFGSRRAELAHRFEVRTARGVLPEDDPRRTSAVLQRAVAATEAEDLVAAAASLRSVIEDEEDLLTQDLPGASVPAHTGAALALAFFLDQVWAERPAKRVEASPWYEAAANLACQLLAEQTQAAPKDSLQEAGSLVRAVLPEGHIIASRMEALVEANRSAQTKSRLKQQEEQLQAELAERLVEAEWPDQAAMAAMRQAEIEALTPVPERIWALKNVGSTLAMGGPASRPRARQLLERAVNLKREFVGGAKHPGMLPEFDALETVLEADIDWQPDAAALRLRMLSILSSIAELYVRAGDTASAVILLEAAVKEYEELLGMRQADIVAATRRANSLFETLSGDDKTKVVATRRRQGVVSSVIGAFVEEVASRQVPGRMHNFERWNEEGVKMLGSLV